MKKLSTVNIICKVKIINIFTGVFSLLSKADDRNCAFPSLIELNKFVRACLSESANEDDNDCGGGGCMKDEDEWTEEDFDNRDDVEDRSGLPPERSTGRTVSTLSSSVDMIRGKASMSALLTLFGRLVFKSKFPLITIPPVSLVVFV